MPTIRKQFLVAVDFLVLRMRWVLLAWACLWAASHAHRSLYSWHYFVTGSHIIVSSDALHLYARHSELQIGPIALLLTAPLVLLLPAIVAKLIALGLMSGAGVFVVLQLAHLQPRRTQASERALLIVGLLLLPVWEELAVQWGHPDDIALLVFAVLALRACGSGKFGLAALAIAAAVDCKPWALGLLPLLLLAPRKDLLRVFGMAMAGIGALWLPFVVADHRTLSASQYRIANSASSALRALGVHSAQTPSWDRIAQITLALVMASIAVKKGRWSAVLLIVVAARLLLDPATKSYYDAGIVLGAAIVDLALIAGSFPLLTAITAAFFVLPPLILSGQPASQGMLRASFLIAILLASVLPWKIRRPVRMESTQTSRAGGLKRSSVEH